MGLNTTITGPVQVRSRMPTGAAGFPAGLIYPRELFWNGKDGILYRGGDTVDANGFATTGDIVAGAGAYLLKSLLGAANGVAPLGSDSKVPLANLPSSITGAMTYQGTWNPNTNTPTLLSGQGTKGYLYKVSVKAQPVVTTAGAGSASGTNTVTVASATGITVGQLVTGAGVGAGTTVQSISGTTVTLTANLTGAVTNGQQLTFTPYLDGISQLYPGDQVVFDGTTWDKIEGSPTEVYSVAGRTGDVVLSVSDVSGAAPLASPAFTGAPTAPTPVSTSNDNTIPTTSWAKGLFATLLSPAFTGTPTAPTPAVGDSSGLIATTAFVQGAVNSTIKRTAINDANYTILSTDRSVALIAITAPRAFALPAASGYPLGAILTIFDESGAVSGANTLTVSRNGTDTINGGSTVVISIPYGFLALQSNGASKWTIIDVAAPVQSVAGRTGAIVLTSADLTDATVTGRTLLTASSVQSQRTTLQIENTQYVADTSPTASATASDVIFTSMSAPRTITLPAASALAAGRTITVGDDSGQCSSTNTITVQRAGTDTINGGTSDVMAVPYSNTRYRSNGNNAWTIVAKVPATSTGGIDGGTV